MSEPSTAPAVVAVVVTRDAGDWLAEMLTSLSDQDYPRLAVLVIDNAGDADPAPLLARHLPSAVLRRLDGDEGFGAAANQVTELVEGAAFYLFCHDDIALAPDAVSLLVAEAVRGNAGIVGPKLVRWEEPGRLLAVGATADRLGVVAPLVERDELDQEQHDRVRDVVVVPGACTLVRADLFDVLDGFDAEIDYLGDDLDLCWRAHLAGARVVVAPDARVRHLEALGQRRGDDRRRLQHRHRLRSLLATTSTMRLVALAPAAMLLSVIEALYALVNGRPGHARDVLGAWTWNLRRARSLRAKRRQVQGTRQVSDRDLATLQASGSARMRSFLRDRVDRDDKMTALGDAGRSFVGSITTGPRRRSAVAWVVVLVVVATATRHVWTRGIPAINEMAAWPSGGELRSVAVSGFRSSWLGTAIEPPLAAGLVGLVDLVPLTTATLRTVVIIGAIPLGLLGAWRLVGAFGSRHASIAALVVAAASPLPYAGLAQGSWTLLVTWAAMPFVLARVARIGGFAPFDTASGLGRQGTRRTRTAQIAGLALLLAVVGATAPVAVGAAAVLCVALFVGSVLAGDGVRASLVGLVALVVAVVWAAALHLPWVIGAVEAPPPLHHLFGAGLFDGPDGVGAMVRADVGPLGGVLGWAPLVVAAVPVLVGRDWRLHWAIRAWATLGAATALAWAVGQTWWDGAAPDPTVVLALAGPMLPVAAAAAVVTRERDVPAARLGWRQLVVAIGVIALAVTPLPLFAELPDGRVDVPAADLYESVGFLDADVIAAPGPTSEDGAAAGLEVPPAERVLWIGHPHALPLPGQVVLDDVEVAVTDGLPDLIDQWPAIDDDATAPVLDAVGELIRGDTSRVGRRLAPAGIGHVVVAEAPAPSFTSVQPRPVDPRILDRLDQQLDLRRVPTDRAVVVYRNDAAIPVDAVGPAGAFDDADDVASAVAAAEPAPDRVGSGTEIYSSRRPLDRFDLTVSGSTLRATPALGVGQAALADAGGTLEISRDDPPWRWAMLAALALAWMWTWWRSLRGITDEGRAVGRQLIADIETADPVAGLDDEPPGRRARRRRRREERRRRRRTRPDATNEPIPAGVT